MICFLIKYSILYYNSEIWHLHSLKVNLNQKLLSSSAKAIKACVKFNVNEISFNDLHKMYNRATPESFLLYKHAINLFELLNAKDPTQEWVALNFNPILTSRHTLFMATKSNQKRVVLNAQANRVL